MLHIKKDSFTSRPSVHIIKIMSPFFFKAERKKKQKGSTSPLQDEPEEEELDDETQALDAVAMERIKQIIAEYQEEMDNYESKKESKCVISLKNK